VKVDTEHQGLIEVPDDKILVMPEGMPGFPGAKRFVILDREDTRPLFTYQCADDPFVSFLIIDPRLVEPDYRVDLQAVQAEKWPESPSEGLETYVIVNTNRGPGHITVNLMAPLIVNTTERQAVQVVLQDGSHSHRHPLK